MDCKNLWNCDSIDDAAGKAASFLNGGRDVYLLYDSHELCALVTGKIKEHEMHVNIHTGTSKGILCAAGTILTMIQ